MPKPDKKNRKKEQKQSANAEVAIVDVDDSHAKVPDSEASDDETSDQIDDQANDISSKTEHETTEDGIITSTPFSSLNLHPSLLSSISSLKWSNATQIQASAIPPALEGRDVIGLAETGSGKTGAFAIPILNYLLDKPQKQVFAVILAPTRELAFQIHEVMVALGRGMGANSVCVVGGVDMASQAIALARNPHIVVATVSDGCQTFVLME